MRVFTLKNLLLLGLLAFVGTAYAQKQADANVVFYETFDNTEEGALGGNDGHFGNYTDENGASVSVAADDATTDVCVNPGWTFSEKGISQADKCIRIGSKKNTGVVTTPALDLEGNATLTFRACAWNSTKKDGTVEYDETTINVTMTGGTLDNEQPTIGKDGFVTVTLHITNATPGATITFSGMDNGTKKDKKGRFFLDDVKVTKDAATAISTVTVANGNAAAPAVYTLSGVRVKTTGKLPSGLYIIGGKKVLVK